MITDVQGIPALLLVVSDKEDPVAVGSNAVYEVIVTNQGSLAATGVKVQCKLEESMALVNGSGPTKVIGNKDGIVTFAPLKTLGINEKAVWLVTVQAKQEGDVRFNASVSCDQFQNRPVEEAESTEFYK
jgi:uncharacterized repeat protein (TIGR01451 family)